MKVNIIGIILFIAGLIILIYGAIVTYLSFSNYRSINMAGEPTYYIDWTSFFYTLSGPLTYGLVLIGVSEIIRLLHKQQPRTAKNHEIKETGNLDSSGETKNTSAAWTMSEVDEEKIYELYSDKAILEIIPSPKEGFCIIKLQNADGPLNPYIKIADVSGLGAREVHDGTIRLELMNWYEKEERNNS